MFTAVIIVHVIASVVIILTVLLQSGKGASIGASFGGAGSQTLFGSAGPASFLLKITVISAVIFMSTSMYMTVTSGGSSVSSVMSEVKGAAIKKKTKPAVKPKAVKKTAAKPAKKPAAVKKIKVKALKPAPIVGKKAVKSKKKAVTKHKAKKKTTPVKKKTVKSKKAVTGKKTTKQAAPVKKGVVKGSPAKTGTSPEGVTKTGPATTAPQSP